jgi:hypothetical protein
MESSSFISVQPKSAVLRRYSAAPGPPVTYCESSSRFDYSALAAASSARSLHLSADSGDSHRSSFCTAATVGAYDISR